MQQRIDQHLLDITAHRRQRNLLLINADLAGHQVLTAADAGVDQLAPDATDQRHVVAIHAHGHVVQGTALLIQGQRLAAVGEDQRGSDQAAVFRIGNTIIMPADDDLAVAQAHHELAGSGAFHVEAGDLRAVRDRQLLLADQRAILSPEERQLATVGQPHANLGLLFHCQHQGRAAIGSPGRLITRAFLQIGPAEQRQHLGQQVEEDEQDSGNHTQATDRYIPAGKVILEMTYLAVALHRFGIKVDTGVLGG